MYTVTDCFGLLDPTVVVRTVGSHFQRNRRRVTVALVNREQAVSADVERS